MAYDLKPLHAPRLSGLVFKIFTRVLESKFPGKLIAKKLMADTRLLDFRKIELDEVPVNFPLIPAPKPATTTLATTKIKQFASSVTQKKINSSPDSFTQPSIIDFQNAYKKKTTTPIEVAQKVIDAIKDSNDPKNNLRAMIEVNEKDIMSQARASAARWKKNKPIGLLDGIPISIKDELDLSGYHTTVGTQFLGQDIAKTDATVVDRLRKAGAILIGKANMHEIGIGVTGYNANHGICRNPHNPEHYSGGSSSGSGSSVAAGLCPVSVGADGGGSIRIPAGFCGVYGLKATFGRISEHGAAPLCWSVAHVGPLAANPVDLSVSYALMAGPDTHDANTLVQPSVELPNIKSKSLKGVRIGIYDDFFNDSDTQTRKSNKKMLDNFKKAGAKIIKIEIPELESIRVAHVMTIASEMFASFETLYPKNHKKFGRDVRVNLAIASNFTSRDYVRAQQVRARALKDMDKIFESVDCIITPTTAIPAPLIKPDVPSAGESDLPTLTDIMRFMVLANLTGNPAVALPTGYNEEGLPLSMQIIGDHWNESLLLKMCHVSADFLERKKPQVYYDLLND